TGGTSHHFDLGGLLVDDHYDCLAAPICPQTVNGPAAFAFDTGSTPDDLVPVTAEIDPKLGMTGAYPIFNLEVCGGQYDWLHIVDPQGRSRWWHPMPLVDDDGVEARYSGNNIVVWGGGMTKWGRARMVDLFLGEIYDSATTLTDYDSVI